MNGNAKIIVTVSPDGDGTEVKVEGVKGKSCTDLTRDMEMALGAVVHTEKTNEYHERQDVHVTNRN